jgi:hypothetical protein
MSAAHPVLSGEIEAGDITAPLERLRAGEPFVELRQDNVLSRAASLDALLGKIAETETKLVWIGNPLRSPLTLERLFLQAAGPEADLRVDRTPGELVNMLRSALDGAARCLVIVQQPETLNPEARDTLARIAPLLGRASPTIQFLFCGTDAFRSIAPVAHDPLSGFSRLGYETLPEPESSTREKLPLLILLIVVVLGTIFASYSAEKPAAHRSTAPVVSQSRRQEIGPESQTETPSPPHGPMRPKNRDLSLTRGAAQ